VEISGAQYPENYNGKQIVPMQGTSLLPHFSKHKNERGPIFWEHEANIGMRNGDWKMVAKTLENENFDPEKLELYDISKDPAEMNDLAKVHPEKLDNMYKVWNDWAEYVKVFPMDSREYNVRSRGYKLKINGEFDMDFGDWTIRNSKDFVDFKIDRSGKISVDNSAVLTVTETGVSHSDAALMWVFSPEHINQFEISLSVLSNRNTTINVCVEHDNQPEIKIAQKSFQIGSELQKFEFKTDKIQKEGRYRLSFYLGTNPAGDQIFLDDIHLKPIN